MSVVSPGTTSLGRAAAGGDGSRYSTLSTIFSLIVAGWRGTGRSNPSRETKFSGANGEKEDIFFLFS